MKKSTVMWLVVDVIMIMLLHNVYYIMLKWDAKISSTHHLNTNTYVYIYIYIDYIYIYIYIVIVYSKLQIEVGLHVMLLSQLILIGQPPR